MNKPANKKTSWLKPVFIVTSAVLFLVALGYLWFDYRFPSWEEEVLLPDGRMIVVKQRRDFIEGYGTRKTWLTFSLPEMGGERTWAQWLYPTMIGAADGKVYVVGRPRGSKQFRMYNYPRYVYVAFVWNNEVKKFTRVPLLSVPDFLRRKENILWCLPPKKERLATWLKKDVLWCEDVDKRFPKSRDVDLNVRKKEAEAWAKLVNLLPQSE